MADPGVNGPLIGWKAIAAHFRRDERTVMRWAATRGLPVKRVPGEGRSTIFAEASALDAWLITADSAPEDSPLPAAAPPAPARPSRPWAWRISTGIAMLAVILGLVWVTQPHRPATATVPTPALPADSRARAAYLQATYDWNQRSADSLGHAITEFGTAIAHDPTFAPSYSGLAGAYLVIRDYGAMSDAEAYPKAKAAADAALALDPDDPAAHRALGFVAFWWQGDRRTAAREFATAIRLDPRDPVAHQWLATALSANGEPALALREATAARLLDPASTAAMVDYLRLGYIAHPDPRYLRALQSVQANAPEMASVPRILATIALYEGRRGDYLAFAARNADLRHDATELARLAVLARAFRAGGAPAFDRALIADAEATSGPSHDFRVAQALAVTGDADGARAMLARICRTGQVGSAMAAGDLWLARAIPPGQIRALCHAGSLAA